MRPEEKEHNPFRDLIETWLLHEMIVHGHQMGRIVKELVTLEDFSTVTSKSIYRSIMLGGDNVLKITDSIVGDYPDKVKETYLARLAIMKKTPKPDYREVDLLPDLDLGILFDVLRRDDDGEIIDYCVWAGLYPGEIDDGHFGQVRGVRP